MIRVFISNIIKSFRSYKSNRSLEDSRNIKLTKEEKRNIKNFWKKENISPSSYICYEFYKYFGILEPSLVPNNIYAEAERLLNPFRYSLFLQHKCCLKYFLPEENRPITIIQNIDNHYLDKGDNVISKLEAIDLVKKYNSFFVKISAGSGGGRGIMKVNTQTDNIEKIFDDYKKDFICQEPLVEHDTLARFSNNCINTIRVLSLNINDNCTILSSFIRMGGLGSIVDNLHSSTGSGALVGIKPDAHLHPFGIDKHYNKVYKSPSGLPFEGLTLDHYETVVDFVKYWHPKSFPFANLIGWDIIIGQNNQPIVIEINLDSADIAAHQVFNGPIFGKRTEEVLNYLKINNQNIIVRI